MRSRRRLVTVAVAAATLATACSGGSSGAPSGQAAAYPGRDSPGGTPDPNGVLRYGVDFPSEFTPNTFDPGASLNSCDKIDEGLIYSTLTQLSPTGQLEPGLAQSWSFQPGGMSLTLHLRPNVFFSNGTPVDASAVRLAILHNKKDPTRTSLFVIKDIVVLNSLTLRLDLDLPTPADLVYAFNDLDGMIEAPSTLNGSAAKHPIGSGPYTLVSASPSEIVLKKNPKAWDASQYQPAEIDFVQVGVGPPAIAALEAGSIDMTAFQPESLPTVKADPALGYDVQPSHAYLTIMFRLDTPPVNNELVRKAINYAINRNQINDVILEGTGTVTDETYAPNQPVAFNPSVANEYPYDPAKARQLLAQAGYPHGVAFSMVIPAGVTETEREAPLLQSEMAPAGIHMKIVSVDPGDLLDSFYLHKENDAIAIPYPAEEEYARELYDKYGALGFTAKLTGSVRPELQHILVEGMGTLNPATLTPIMHEAAKLTTDEALEAPIAFEPQLLAWNLSKIGGHPLAGSDSCRPDFSGFFIKK